MPNENTDNELIGTRTDRRIIKSIETLEKTITRKNRHNAIIIADSKGRELKKQRESNTHVAVHFQGGAKLRNFHLDACIKRHLNDRSVTKPIILIWLGTCELTKRGNNGFQLQPNITSYTNNLISSYQMYKNELLDINPRATVLFLECPYFHLQTFNLEKGHINSNISISEQKSLERAIIHYNNSLITLNGISAPLISEDLVKYGKGKQRRRMQKNIDYRQLSDGCHPSPSISRLWLLRFIKLIDRL